MAVRSTVLKPTVQALILADYVYQDKQTGKKVIAGTFNRLVLRKKKATGDVAEEVERKTWDEVRETGSPFAFISLTDVRSPVDLELRYVNLSDNRVLLQTSFKATCHDPLQTLEAVVPVPRLPIPAPGTYALELLHDNEILGALRITAVEQEVD